VSEVTKADFFTCIQVKITNNIRANFSVTAMLNYVLIPSSRVLHSKCQYICPSSRRIPFGNPRGWKYEHDADIVNTESDWKLDTLKFCIYILLFALWYITSFSTKIACDLCIFSLLLARLVRICMPTQNILDTLNTLYIHVAVG
jgi:hypothetical protein